MARGAAQAQKKRRQQPQPKQKRNAGQSWEDQLFFARLRRHTKWMFVLLALVFGVGFVAFGVGSGSTGISDIFRNGLFGGGGSSGVSGRIKDDQKKIRTNPNNIEAYRDLATLYQQKHETSQAIGALNQAAKVQPKNLDVRGDLARIYRGQAESAKNDAAAAQNALASRAVTPPGLDLNSTLGQALGSDPLTQSLRTNVSDAFTKMSQAFTKAETAYKRVATAARGTSQEPNAQLQVASLAVEAVQATGQQSDIVVAANAYKRYLKLEPKGVSASQARQTLAQLQSFLPKSRR
jgi:tetratricopeptide (TPR) repeat protein